MTESHRVVGVQGSIGSVRAASSRSGHGLDGGGGVGSMRARGFVPRGRGSIVRAPGSVGDYLAGPSDGLMGPRY
jgi:hypothetical protein